MLFQLHQYSKISSQQWSQSHKIWLICYSAHLQIDVHSSTHLKKKKNFLIISPIKIITPTQFFSFFCFISHRHSQSPSPSLSTPSPSLISQITPPSLITVATIDQPSPRRPSPSTPSPHLPHLSPSLIALQLISLTHHRRRPSPSQALISLIKLSTPLLSQPIHFRSVLSLFFCSEFFHSLIFLGLV